MILLDKPFVSNEMKEFLNLKKVSVLKNEMAELEQEGYCFNLKDSETLMESANAGERIYTLSENSLDWIYQNSKDKDLLHCIDIMKNKVEFRKLFAKEFPDFYFREVTINELNSLAFDLLPLPLILKPAIGFFSVGVFTILNKEDWESAIQSIQTQAADWQKQYPDCVVNHSTFILEQYITGDEYAIDAYFDQNGNAVILNIMKHDFASTKDVSDRLYYTSADIIREHLKSFAAFLNQTNGIIQAKNFPFHVEIRIQNGRILPIEFNPMRFAGWCCTDLVYFAFGMRTYEYYLNNQVPDWDSLLAGKENKLYTLIVLNKPENCPEITQFDYDALSTKFEKVLCMRKIDYRTFPTFGFVFTETRKTNLQELEYIMNSNLLEFTS